ncbi:hypothetical protein JCM8208_005239 [Rhodotorula glutinis]
MPVTLLSAPPAALSRDELLAISAETPSTFEGIPPLTRHHERRGVRIRVDPAFEGFTGDGLVDGQLFVTEEAVSFYSPSTSSGISLPYPHLTLHAISRQPAPPSASTSTSTSTAAAPNGGTPDAQGGPCVYCQFEESAQMDDDDDGAGTREMWITPESEQAVEAIFAALSLCASLQPSSSTSDPSILSQSASASRSTDTDGPGAMFAAMGLDPSSMVYAAADGSLAGPGLAALEAAEDGDAQWEDAEALEEEGGEEEQGESSAGRTRSDFVNPGRARGAPY